MVETRSGRRVVAAAAPIKKPRALAPLTNTLPSRPAVKPSRNQRAAVNDLSTASAQHSKGTIASSPKGVVEVGHSQSPSTARAQEHGERVVPPFMEVVHSQSPTAARLEEHGERVLPPSVADCAAPAHPVVEQGSHESDMCSYPMVVSRDPKTGCENM